MDSGRETACASTGGRGRYSWTASPSSAYLSAARHQFRSRGSKRPKIVNDLGTRRPCQLEFGRRQAQSRTRFQTPRRRSLHSAELPAPEFRTRALGNLPVNAALLTPTDTRRYRDEIRYATWTSKPLRAR